MNIYSSFFFNFLSLCLMNGLMFIFVVYIFIFLFQSLWSFKKIISCCVGQIKFFDCFHLKAKWNKRRKNHKKYTLKNTQYPSNFSKNHNNVITSSGMFYLLKCKLHLPIYIKFFFFSSRLKLLIWILIIIENSWSFLINKCLLQIIDLSLCCITRSYLSNNILALYCIQWNRFFFLAYIKRKKWVLKIH